MELIVILVLALVVLGPQRIPEVASSLGKAIRGFRKATRELRDQIDIEDEVRRPFEDLRAALRDEAPRYRPPPPLLTTPGDPNFPSLPVDPNFVPAGHGPVGAPILAAGGAALEGGGLGHEHGHEYSPEHGHGSEHGHGPEPGHAAAPLAGAPSTAAPPSAAAASATPSPLIAPPPEPVVRASAGAEPWAAHVGLPEKGVS